MWMSIDKIDAPNKINLPDMFLEFNYILHASLSCFDLINFVSMNNTFSDLPPPQFKFPHFKQINLQKNCKKNSHVLHKIGKLKYVTGFLWTFCIIILQILMQKYCRTITTTLHDYIVAAGISTAPRMFTLYYNLIYFHQKTSLSHEKNLIS